MKILKVAGTSFDTFKRLVVKAWNGKSDVRTAIEASSYGIDSNPVKDMVAIYTKTELDGNEYIIGYLNKNRLAEIGETRLFSTDSTGTLKTFVWLKSDGTMQLGGTIHNAVRYTPLNTGLQNEVALINAELVKIAAAINAIAPGSYTPALISLNISASKINEIKTL
jgi:hypothetical protein